MLILNTPKGEHLQGPIVQVLALVLHGNKYLQTGEVKDFFPTNSVFQFCERVSFASQQDGGGSVTRIPYAANPTEWFQRLRAENVEGLRAHYTPRNEEARRDRRSVGSVGGGGRWLIEAVKDQESDLWEGQWEVGNKDDPYHRVWLVVYDRIAEGWKSPDPRPHDLSGTAADLETIIVKIREFAESHEENDFVAWFNRGLDRLTSDNPMEGIYHEDLCPAGIVSLEAMRLLAASQEAWVFGGMGSWNDIGFTGKEGEVYESLSESLFQLLSRAAVEAANTTCRQKDRRPWWKLW
jgi:hypothetical protein